jgi:VCBS repeat protein
MRAGLRTVGAAALAVAAALAGAGTAPAAAGVVVHLVPTASSDAAGSYGDFTGDGIADILAREKGTGKLKVYPHSRTVDGTRTYPTVTTINAGWGSMRWIGVGDVDGNGYADVLAITPAGELVVARHSGTFNGLATLLPGLTVLDTGWLGTELVFTADFNADGFADLVTTRLDAGETVVRLNNGGIDGTRTFQAPRLVLSGVANDNYEGMSDVTKDGVLDLVFVGGGNALGLVDLTTGSDHLFSVHWESTNATALTGTYPTILARDRHTDQLLGYDPAQVWDPENPSPRLAPPMTLGTNWQINDIIT